MAETIIVGFIIVGAAAFAAYRLFIRPSCSCANSCGNGACCQSGKRKPSDSSRRADGTHCACGK